jgi:hypothetical protein
VTGNHSVQRRGEFDTASYMAERSTLSARQKDKIENTHTSMRKLAQNFLFDLYAALTGSAPIPCHFEYAVS